MSKIRILHNPHVLHAAVGYSHGTQSGNLFFISDMVALDKDGNLVGVGSLEVQLATVLQHIDVMVRDFGGTKDNILQFTVYTKLLDMPTINAVCDGYFQGACPSRVVVHVNQLREPGFIVAVSAVGAIY